MAAMEVDLARILMITANTKLAATMEQLCDMLDYRFQSVEHLATDVEAAIHADLIIIDAVNGTEAALLELISVSIVAPVLWIVDGKARIPAPNSRVLRNPFTVSDAIRTIQRTLHEQPRAVQLPASFLYKLLMASSPREILEGAAQCVIDGLQAERVGIIQLDENTNSRWVYWHNPPDASIQKSLVRLMEGTSAPPWYSVPFVSGDVRGAMLMECSQPLDDDQLGLLRDVAGVTARVWMRELSLTASRERIIEMQAFDLLGRGIVGRLNPPEVLEIIVNSARRLINAESVVVWLRQDQNLVAVAQSGQPQPLIAIIKVDGENLWGKILDRGQPVLVGEEEFIDFFPPNTIRQIMCVPLNSDQTAIGMVQVINPTMQEIFTIDDEWRLRKLASWSVIAINNARLHQQTQTALQRERSMRAKLVQTEKLTALGRLVASVAHEINNPLQIIQSGLDFVMGEVEKLPSEVGENLHIIQGAVDQVGGVIQRIKTIYRMPDQRPRTTDLNDLLQQVAEMLTHHLRQKDIRLTMELDPVLPLVSCVPHEIRQVFLNLALNAIDAVGDGGVITFSSGYAEDAVTVTVSDTGEGMSDDVMRMIFEPFFTTKNEGSGLGLAVSQDIVKQYGGRITVASERGIGTRFTVWLPAYQPESMNLD